MKIRIVADTQTNRIITAVEDANTTTLTPTDSQQDAIMVNIIPQAEINDFKQILVAQGYDVSVLDEFLANQNS